MKNIFYRRSNQENQLVFFRTPLLQMVQVLVQDKHNFSNGVELDDHQQKVFVIQESR